MPSLAEFQRDMVADIMRGQPRDGAVAVHQNTVLGALVNALRLTFPTVARLMGANDFERHATQYARDNPPRSPVLYSYGASFPETLHSNLLRDIARFDLALDRTAHQDANARTVPMEIYSNLRIRLPRSLSHLRVDHPVDLVRDALDAGRPEDLATLDLTPRVRHFAIWRGNGSGATVRHLTSAAGAFLAALLNSGGQAEQAMRSALEHAPPEQIIAAIQAQILHASFTTLLWHSRPGTPQ
jgi:Putative DNA-binding domain